MARFSRRTPLLAVCMVVAALSCEAAPVKQLSSQSSSQLVKTKAWRSQRGLGDQAPYLFPEQSREDVQARENTAISFSGGGARSFEVSIGYLKALADIGVLDHVRYIGGISGGSWAATSYVYAPESNLTRLLGDVTLPENITMDGLKAVRKGCARASPVNHNLEAIGAKYLVDPFVSINDVWPKTVWATYLNDLDIPFDGIAAMDEQHVSEMLERNPQLNLKKSSFVTPRNNTPFLVVGTTVLGPMDVVPLKLSNRSNTRMEYTPLYCGQAFESNVTYNGHDHNTVTIATGGFVDTIGCGTMSPVSGLQANQTGDILTALEGKARYTPAFATGISSWAPGGTLAEILPEIAKLDIRTDVWPTYVDSPKSTEMAMGDGGLLENVMLIGMLKRRVKSIVLFCNFERPLNSSYNPTERPPAHSDLDDDVTTYFGFVTDKTNPAWDVHRDQVFAKEDWRQIAEQLLAGQKKGTGAIATAELCTIENKWWGIPKGICANVTFVYLTRLLEWERRLSDDLREMVQPKHDVDNPSVLPSHGVFKDFPNIPTSTEHYKAEQANLLADMSGWLILENRELFKQLLAPNKHDKS